MQSLNERPVLLEINGLTKGFPGVQALDHVDFTLRAGEIHGLLGENGAGKSTLIKVLTGVFKRDAGSIRLDRQEIEARDPADALTLGIGTVYQEVNLLPNLSVAENLFIGRQPHRFGLVRTGEMRRRSAEILSTYGLDINVADPLGRFSVAVQQIVAIARAVDLSAKVLILDEPTASLDAHEVETLFRILDDLKKRGIGIVFVTHFLGQVYAVCDRITVLRNGRLVGSRPAAELPRIELVSMMLGRELAAEALHRNQRPAVTGDPMVAFTGY
ncbi:MAG TPA: ATP-binding cassette domain-containing protein, partial [Microvirga sp.]|nr:ATP-binding cassette domain-containing protein [Microvirga sp.]